MHPNRVAVVWQNHDESEDAAITRWCAARPGEPRPDLNSGDVHFIRWESPQWASTALTAAWISSTLAALLRRQAA
jgi:hypothetical protein